MLTTYNPKSLHFFGTKLGPAADKMVCELIFGQKYYFKRTEWETVYFSTAREFRANILFFKKQTEISKVIFVMKKVN